MPDYSRLLDDVPMRRPELDGYDGPVRETAVPYPERMDPERYVSPYADVKTDLPDAPGVRPAIEYLPVYEWQGQTYVGPLEFAPSLPQDLQPTRYVMVPTQSPEMI